MWMVVDRIYIDERDFIIIERVESIVVDGFDLIKGSLNEESSMRAICCSNPPILLVSMPGNHDMRSALLRITCHLDGVLLMKSI